MFAGTNVGERIIVKILSGSAAPGALLCALSSAGSFSASWIPKFRSNMSGQAVPGDLSGHMLDLEEDEDLEVFTKVTITSPNRPNLRLRLAAPDLQPLFGSYRWLMRS